MAERPSDGYFSELRDTSPPETSTPTQEELAALACVSHGLTTKMAAEVLGKSPYTVSKQLRSARFRLGAKNTTHAIAKAFRAGLIN